MQSFSLKSFQCLAVALCAAYLPNLHANPNFNYLGEGECRQGDGEYPMKFSTGYYDLNPHTSGNNADQALTRCQDKCEEHSDWCIAIELVTRDIWATPECRLVSDAASFAAAGMTIQNDNWGGTQMIDGQSYQTYCAGGGSGQCATRVWGGGSLYSRAGYHCYTNETPAPTSYTYAGEGECRQGNGEYPMKFSKSYSDLNPHTSGNNADQALTRCQDKCDEHSDWCLAIELVTRDIWPTPECRLVSDAATFSAAGMVVQNDTWGGTQTIDGESYQTYCAGGGSGQCASRVWGGGSLNSRTGYHCYYAN